MRTRSTRTSRPLNVAGKPVKSRQSFAHADQLARVNPDAAARQLLRSNALLKNSKQRAELWSLLQNLGGDAVVARASKAILTTRHTDELQAVLSAASADCWNGTASAIEVRFHRECARAKESDSELLQRLRALAAAAISLDATLEAADLRRLLKSPVSATRAIGAEIVARQSRWDLVLETLPLCWDRGEARIFAGQALGVMGGEEHAAELWSRALAARKANRQRLLHHLLKILGAMGAFDIQLPLKFWIEDDVASNEAATTRNPWFYGTLWSRLLSAKLGAGAATREEALEELRWFVRVAGPELPRVPGAASNPDRFDVAQTFVLLGAESEAEELLKRFASRGLPSPAEYPKLLFASLRPHVEADTTPAGVAWLAASGDEAARKKVLDGFAAALKQGQRPEHWELRDFFDREQIAAIARQALHQQPAGTLRQILALLYAEHSASLVKDCVTRLARTHSSSVVQWKARQLREALKNTTQPRLHPRAIDYSFQRWVRLDAAILSGALRPGHAPKAPPKEESHPPSGILKPVRAGQGYLLSTAGLSAESRRQTIKELLSNSLSKALQRELPLGPSLEERPDIKAVREPAPPQNELDEHMAELAQAVMSMWNEADEALTLDEEGLRLMAAALSTEARVLDEDDLEACGAFIGEVLRKRVGGSWTGYDDNYRLEIPVPSSVIAGEEGESMEVLVFDPLGWAREINMRKDVVEGTQLLLENFQHALNKAKPQSAALKFHVNPSQAFEAAIMKLGDLPPLTPMTELLAEARAFVFRLLPEEWPAVLAALEPLIEGTWVRVAASFAIYAPGEAFCRLWARWGAGKMKDSAFVDAIIEAIGAVIERDDLEAMPHWTIQPAQSRHAFLHPLRKRMPREMWRKVLQLLLRQRAGAGDRAGVSWCLYSYKYEFPDVLPLVELFCALSVSARQTLLRSTVHATMDERKLFRPLWAEALRDPAPAVVLSALEAVAVNNVRSLRALVQALTRDKRESIADAASEVLGAWEG